MKKSPIRILLIRINNVITKLSISMAGDINLLIPIDLCALMNTILLLIFILVHIVHYMIGKKHVISIIFPSSNDVVFKGGLSEAIHKDIFDATICHHRKYLTMGKIYHTTISNTAYFIIICNDNIKRKIHKNFFCKKSDMSDEELDGVTEADIISDY